MCTQEIWNSYFSERWRHFDKPFVGIRETTVGDRYILLRAGPKAGDVVNDLVQAEIAKISSEHIYSQTNLSDIDIEQQNRSY